MAMQPERFAQVCVGGESLRLRRHAVRHDLQRFEPKSRTDWLLGCRIVGDGEPGR
jgi:hypothetical protein